MRRNNRPCKGCPFREDAPDRDERLGDYDPGGEHIGLTEWVCHKTIPDSTDERLCAGAQIVAGLMSPVGRPACSLPNQGRTSPKER